MPESLGVRLRRRREEQHIALSTIAERTKIKASLLEALERDDVSQWPAGIYRRAFIRSYANAIGLDPDPVVREFLDLYPDPEEAVAEAPPPPSGLRGVVGLALGSLARLGRGPASEPTASRTGTLNLNASVPPPAFQSDPQFDSSVEPLAETFAAFEEQEPDTAPEAEPVMAEVHEAPAGPAVAEPRAMTAVPEFELDLTAVARVCTGFARVETGDDVPPLLADASKALGALGLIVWVWDPIVEGLRPVVAHGYSEKLLAQFPTVGQDDDNATAAAYRTGEACSIKGSGEANGALVVPLMTAPGPSGVLAIELPNGREAQAQVRAAATIFAGMLAPLICEGRTVQPEPVPEPAPPPSAFTPPAFRSNNVRR